MKTIIAIIVTAIIILLATKKNYKELLVFLVGALILDWIFLYIFPGITLIRTIGIPLLSILFYAFIELISMGIFYFTLKKYNYVIPLIVYLVINLLINNLFAIMPGNSLTSGIIIIDLLFYLVIGIIIIIVYKKNTIMESIEWFAIIGMIINCLLTYLMLRIWELIGLTVFMFAWVFVPLLMPYILGIVSSAILILLVRKWLVNRNKKIKIAVYLIIILVCGFVSIKGGYAFLAYESAKPDKTYSEINKINDNKSLIGLSKEEVKNILGEPLKETDEEKNNYYTYNGGTVTDMLFFGERKSYIFRIYFDENNKVERTLIKETQ